MSKYNYKRDVFKGLTPFPFLGEVKTRIKNIEAAEATIPQSVFNPNILSARLHPAVQFAKVADKTEQAGAVSFTLVPDTDKGTSELAYFRAGQYVSLALEIDGKPLTRAYTIASSPKKALGAENTAYVLTIKRNPGGKASVWLPDNLNEGDSVTMSGPLGNFYYEPLRDAKNVVALAGGSGITPFLAMAEAIADGTEDFNLIVLYGSRTEESIILADKLDAASEKSNGKVRVVNILSEEEKDGYEHGFITAELISKYAPEGDFSVFVCGPAAMYDAVAKEISKLGLKDRRVRFEVPGEFGDPAKAADYPLSEAGKSFKVKVSVRGDIFEAECRSDQTLLEACEAAGIAVPSDCRSGECGWCHSRLISGDVFVPEERDKRRAADKKFGWIHPCITYPLSDTEIEVFPLMK